MLVVMIALFCALANLLFRSVFFLLTIGTLLSTTFSTAWGQLGCGGFNGAPSPSGGPQSLDNGQLCINKPGAPAQLRIIAANVADGSNPNNFAVEIDWDDGSPRQILTFGGSIPILNTAPHAYDIPSLTHVFLPRPCVSRPGAECSYRPRVFLRIAGTTCPAQFGTSPDYFRFNTDDQCSGDMNLSETSTGVTVFEVGAGVSTTVTFTDRTTLNCLPPQELTGLNFTKRWRRFVYGTFNTITGGVLVGGAPVTFPFVPPGMPTVSGEPVSSSSPPFATNNTLTISIPATAQVGEEFHIRMDYWNYCNQFTDGDAAVFKEGIIRVVGLIAQTISFGSLPVATYGDSQFALGGTATSGLNVTYSSSNTNVATITDNNVTIVGAGTTTITAYQTGNNVYAPATAVTRNLTINKAELSVQANSKSRVYGAANPELTVSYGGFKKSDTEAVIDTKPIASTSATQSSNVGSYNIVPAGGLDNNYSFLYTNGTLTITKASLTATADNKVRDYGAPNPILSITYSGLRNGENSSVINIPPTISTTAIITSPVGTYPIIVAGGSDDNYALTLVNGSLTIGKKQQSVSFTVPSDIVETSGSFTLTATSTSGLPVTFTTTDAAKVSISGNTVTIISPGKITITASQTGNGNYQAAPSLGQTICINPKKPIITPSALNTTAPILTSSSNSGNQWFRNGGSIAGAINTIYTVTDEGSYQLKVMIDGCTSEFSDSFEMIVTAISSLTPELKLVVFPNPVQTELGVIVQGAGPSETYELTVYDNTGRIIEKLTMNMEQYNMPIDHYPAGNYTLHVANNKLTLVGRFIKR